MAFRDRTILELPEIIGVDAASDGFWILASKEGDGVPYSGRFSFGEYLKEVEERLEELLQLERRLTFKVESTTVDVFIDEEMTIYKVAAVNVSDLSVTVDNVETPIAIGTDVSINIPAGSVPVFNVTKQLTDPTSYLYVYAKIKIA